MIKYFCDILYCMSEIEFKTDVTRVLKVHVHDNMGVEVVTKPLMLCTKCLEQYARGKHIVTDIYSSFYIFKTDSIKEKP